MIQGNQLRIGNMVFDWAKRIATVESINSHDVVRLSSSDYKFESFNLKQHGVSPIPLTEDWLLKFGFEKLKGRYHEDTYMNADLNFGNPVLKLNDYTRLCTNGGYEYLFLDGFRLPCKYLHQLQNLYFALTGNELTIKEN